VTKGIRPGKTRGTWEIRVEIAPDLATGKRRQKSKTLAGSKAEAEREHRRMLKEVEDNGGRGQTKLTVGQAFDRWLCEVKTTRSANYHRGAATLVRMHVKPALGARRLSELTRDDLRQAYAKWAKTLSTNTLITKHRMVHAALNWALDEGLLNRNPADGLRMPAKIERPMSIYDDAEIAKLFEAADGDAYWGPIVKLCVYTGMRAGELLQLTWDSVDLKNGLISLNWRTKTKAGRRAIKLVPEAATLLEDVRKRQTDDWEVWGEAERDGQRWVFRNTLGRKHDHSRLWWAFRDMQDAAGLPHIRFHDLRHSTATALLKMGVDVRIVQEILGHSRSTVTRDIYQHVTAGMQDDAMAKLGQFLRGGGKSEGNDDQQQAQKDAL
jgi:integrase